MNYLVIIDQVPSYTTNDLKHWMLNQPLSIQLRLQSSRACLHHIGIQVVIPPSACKMQSIAMGMRGSAMFTKPANLLPFPSIQLPGPKSAIAFVYCFNYMWLSKASRVAQTGLKWRWTDKVWMSGWKRLHQKLDGEFLAQSVVNTHVQVDLLHPNDRDLCPYEADRSRDSGADNKREKNEVIL